MINDALHLRVKDGKAALLVNGWETVSVDEKKLVDALADTVYPDIGILPPVVRWISPTGKYVLFERPPTMQTIRFHAAKVNEINSAVREHTFQLPMPWTLYAVELGEDHYPTDISVYALAHSLEAEKDFLGILPLPNHYRSGSLCMPSRDYNETCKDIGEGINAAYRIAWMSGFNHDINYNVKHCSEIKRPFGLFKELDGRATALKIYRTWQKKEIQEVANWTDWPEPNAYGYGPNVYGGIVPNVYSLISLLLNYDTQRTNYDPVNNLAITIKQAISAAHLR